MAPMKLKSISYLLFFLLSINFGCRKQSDNSDIHDFVDHWETIQTIITHKNASLLIDTINNNYKVIEGNNEVLIVSTERLPKFKKGKELNDLYSSQELLIELDTEDNFVSAQKPANSKMFRKTIAFSPNHGIKPLDFMEEITLTKKENAIWIINSKIKDFIFNGELNFLTKQKLIYKHLDY